MGEELEMVLSYVNDINAKEGSPIESYGEVGKYTPKAVSKNTQRKDVSGKRMREI